MGRVNHHRSENARCDCIDTARLISVIKMNREKQVGKLMLCHANECLQKTRTGVLARTPRDGQKKRGLGLPMAKQQAAYLLQVVDAVSAQGKYPLRFWIKPRRRYYHGPTPSDRKGFLFGKIRKPSLQRLKRLVE